MAWVVAPLVVSVAACGSHNVRGNALEVLTPVSHMAPQSAVVATGPVTLNGLRLTGRNDGLESRWQPVRVRVHVTVTNISTAPVRVRLLSSNCAVRLRIYKAAAVTGRGPGVRRDSSAMVFNGAARNIQCYVPIERVTLPPGDSTVLQSPGSGPAINLAPGRYDLAGVVTLIPSEDSLHRHGPTAVEVPAGTIRVPEPYE